MRRVRFLCICFAGVALYGRPQGEVPLAFEAASIKPHRDGAESNPNRTGKSGGPAPVGGFLNFRPGMVVSGRRGVTARDMILAAYQVTSPQLTGGPGWLASDSFDVEAKAEGAPQAQLRTMLRTLLAERFQLVVHRRKEMLAIYAIMLPKNGTQLHDWKPGGAVPMPAESHTMNYRGAGTMEDLAAFLSGDPRVGRPALDETGLKGSYILSFGWDSDEEFLASMQVQLGLKLQPGKASLEVIVIDRVERPSPN